VAGKQVRHVILPSTVYKSSAGQEPIRAGALASGSVVSTATNQLYSLTAKLRIVPQGWSVCYATIDDRIKNVNFYCVSINIDKTCIGH
jgi:hypothetical protein